MVYKALASWRVAACIATVVASTASAHPHAWIDVKTTVHLAKDYAVSGISEEWIFDKLYTAYLLKDSEGQWKPLE